MKKYIITEQQISKVLKVVGDVQIKFGLEAANILMSGLQEITEDEKKAKKSSPKDKAKAKAKK